MTDKVPEVVRGWFYERDLALSAEPPEPGWYYFKTVCNQEAPKHTMGRAYRAAVLPICDGKVGPFDERMIHTLDHAVFHERDVFGANREHITRLENIAAALAKLFKGE
jgi:hypothetical protein